MENELSLSKGTGKSVMTSLFLQSQNARMITNFNLGVLTSQRHATWSGGGVRLLRWIPAYLFLNFAACRPLPDVLLFFPSSSPKMNSIANKTPATRKIITAYPASGRNTSTTGRHKGHSAASHRECHLEDRERHTPPGGQERQQRLPGRTHGALQTTNTLMRTREKQYKPQSPS
jgi:hypothetical protein